jgi:hypothetical protein
MQCIANGNDCQLQIAKGAACGDFCAGASQQEATNSGVGTVLG